ncbi:MAG: hypothetical protein L3J09_10540 [Flavobacteriaceae bacterium]|nr:hypothetical protein [Flavobacteriaceae bacterium]
MKNLFFALVFMLIGTFSFASNDVKENIAVVEQNTEITADVEKGEMCYLDYICNEGHTHRVYFLCPHTED